MFAQIAAIFAPVYEFLARVHAVLDHGRGILFDGGAYAAEGFLFMTVFLGGLGAWASGRAVASTWRPMLQAPLYCAGLAAAVRFLHFALFEEELTSIHYYLVTFVLLAAVALLGYRAMRSGQMARQYSWSFARLGPFGWRRIA